MFDRYTRTSHAFSRFPVMNVVKLFTIFGVSVDLHVIRQPDAEECFHTHAYTGYSLGLIGSYTSEVANSAEDLDPAYRRILQHKFMRIHKVLPSTCHRVRTVSRFCVTLWFHSEIPTDKVEFVGEGWELNEDGSIAMYKYQ